MKMFRFISGVFALIVCLCFAFLYSICKNSGFKNSTIIVEDKTTNVPNLLVKSSVSDNIIVARVAVKLLSIVNIKAKVGEFEIPQHASLLQAMSILSFGKKFVREFEIRRGMTVSMLMTQIENNEYLLGTVTEIPEEGTFLPGIYSFSYPTTKQQIIDKAKADMSDFIQQEWPKRSEKCMTKTPDEALILASIVERETKTEYSPVANVYTHRLKINMKLQADPTVIYAIHHGKTYKHHLTLQDLKTKSPYNTYANFGLPPAPIGAPSKESIVAVLHPEDTENLFFVYDDAISRSIFSTNYETHKFHAKRIKANNKAKTTKI